MGLGHGLGGVDELMRVDVGTAQYYCTYRTTIHYHTFLMLMLDTHHRPPNQRRACNVLLLTVVKMFMGMQRCTAVLQELIALPRSHG